MHISYDPAKNTSNIAKHNISFDLVKECDWELAVYKVDKRMEYGETRYIAALPLYGRLHVLAFTYRDGSIRVISFRKANAKERKKYEKGFN